MLAEARSRPEQVVVVFADEKTLYRQPAVAPAYARQGSGGGCQLPAPLSHCSNTKHRLGGLLNAADAWVLFEQGSVLGVEGLRRLLQQARAVTPTSGWSWRGTTGRSAGTRSTLAARTPDSAICYAFVMYSTSSVTLALCGVLAALVSVASAEPPSPVRVDPPEQQRERLIVEISNPSRSPDVNAAVNKLIHLERAGGKPMYRAAEAIADLMIDRAPDGFYGSTKENPGGPWMAYLRWAFEENALSDRTWGEVWAASVRTGLAARPHVVQGDVLPFAAYPNSKLNADRREGKYFVRTLVDWVELEGLRYEVIPEKGHRQGVYYRSDVGAWLQVAGDITAQLTPGPVMLIVSMESRVYEVPPDPYEGERNPADRWFPTMPPPPIPRMIYSSNHQVEAEFIVRPAGSDPELQIVDPTLKAAVEASVRCGVIYLDRDYLSKPFFKVRLQFEHAPVPIAYVAILRDAEGNELAPLPERKHEAAGVADPAETYVWQRRAMWRDAGRLIDPNDPPATLDLILRPDPDEVREQIKPQPAWGEEIVIEDVPVVTEEPPYTDDLDGEARAFTTHGEAGKE